MTFLPAKLSEMVLIYRVLVQRVAVSEAERDLHAVWQPDAVWRRFIRDELKAYTPAA